MTRAYRTALVGAGRIGTTYADDPLTRRHFLYASHAQVLADHPAFAWDAVADPNPDAVARTMERWGLAHGAASVKELLSSYDPEVLVLATPPTVRASAVMPCQSLKAVLCEKPLGTCRKDAAAFLALCDARRISVQVNLWRRFDPLMQWLANGYLSDVIGTPQIVHGVYGNGLINNATHLIDLCRILLGEVVAVQALGPVRRDGRLPLDDDFDAAFRMRFAEGFTAVLSPLDFDHYREVGLDIWGECGRLEIMNEGLVIRSYPHRPHRALTGAGELAMDAPAEFPPAAGDALFRLYDNLAAAIEGSQELMCSGFSAWRTTAVVETLREAMLSGRQTEVVVIYETSSSA
jgi:predicted dehydrogenase